MSTADYLSLLDCPARQTRAGKRGATPKKFAPLFDGLGNSAEIWCRLVKDFGKLFNVVAGQQSQIDEHRSRGSARHYRSRKEARELLSTVKLDKPSVFRRSGFPEYGWFQRRPLRFDVLAVRGFRHQNIRPAFSGPIESAAL